jgi:hypothetical protein
MPSNSLNKISETPATISFISLFPSPARLIIFPTGVNLMSIVLLGTWFNNTYIPKPTSFRWISGRINQFCELALVIKSITAILNEYVLREIIAIRQI